MTERIATEINVLRVEVAATARNIRGGKPGDLYTGGMSINGGTPGE